MHTVCHSILFPNFFIPKLNGVVHKTVWRVTVLYKLALVMLAAILGMFFDVAVFPFATPDSYLDDDWKRAPGAVRLRCADFAIAKGYLWPFVMACLRRAAVVAAFVVAVSVGL